MPFAERTAASTAATLARSILGGRIRQRARIGRAPVPSCREHLGEIGIDVAEGAEESFRVADRHPRGAVGLGRQSGDAALDRTGRPAERREVELVRLLLTPSETALLAVDLQRQAVHAAERDGACPEATDSAAGHAEGDERVVLERPAGDGRGEVGRQRLDLQAGDEAGHVQGVNAGVGKD